MNMTTPNKIKFRGAAYTKVADRKLDERDYINGIGYYLYMNRYDAFSGKQFSEVSSEDQAFMKSLGDKVYKLIADEVKKKLA